MQGAELMAPCGLHCGVCGVYLATQENDEGLRRKMARAYGVEPDQVVCDGCLAQRRFVYCRSCGIRDCTVERGLDGCHQCGDFPCGLIEDFPVPEGASLIRVEVPRRAELGDEVWVEVLTSERRCASCGVVSHRGARRCRGCGEPLGQGAANGLAGSG